MSPYCLTLGWGMATGAAVGGATGTALGAYGLAGTGADVELFVFSGVFGALIGLLNLGVLTLFVVSGAALLEPLPLLLLDNLAGGLVLWPAHRSLARALSEA